METESEVLQRKLDSTVKHYNFLLVQKDKAWAGQLSKLEDTYRSSWKWKIGNLFVESAIRCLNFIKNPARFITNHDYRGTWNGHNSKNGMVHHPVPPSDLPFLHTPGPVEPTVNPQTVKTDQQSIVQDKDEALSGLKKQASVKRVDNKPVVAAILDDFSANTLQQELNLITFRPDSWQAIIGVQTPEVLLVESAIRGNKGSWQYKISKTPGFMGDELPDLVNWTKDNKVPSLFWFSCNSGEDVNFYDKARLFDYILVSNTGNMDGYRKIFGNERVLSFPFAIQPRLHNPIDAAPGKQHVSFFDKSETDVSRKILASLASGTPVITNFTPIHPDLDDLLLFGETENDAREHIDQLLNDPLARMKLSVRGIRKVMESHRYDQRLHAVLKQVGIASQESKLPDICLLINVNPGINLVALANSIILQTHPPKCIVLLSENSLDHLQAAQFSTIVAPARVLQQGYYENQLSRIICESARCDYYAIWDAADLYGPEYLKDYALATLFSDAVGFGKGNFYAHENGHLSEENKLLCYSFTSSVPVGTLMLKSNRLASLNFLLLLHHAAVYDSFLPDILSLDPLNYIQNLSGSAGVEDNFVKSVFA